MIAGNVTSAELVAWAHEEFVSIRPPFRDGNGTYSQDVVKLHINGMDIYQFRFRPKNNKQILPDPWYIHQSKDKPPCELFGELEEQSLIT